MSLRVLFTPLGEIGHVNPLVGICQRLVREGHAIGVHCRRNFALQLSRAGVAAEWFGELPDEPHVPPDKLASRLREPRWLEHWYRRALATTGPECDAIEATVHAFRPDVMAIDPLNAAAAIVAERAGLPWAGISTNFAAVRPTTWSCTFLDVGGRAVEMLHAVAARHHVSLRLAGTDAVSPWFNTVFTTEDLAPRAGTSNDFSHFVGPSRLEGPRGDETPFAFDRLDRRPLVYVASGGGQSLAFDAAQLLCIARAIDADGAAMVIASPVLHADAAFRAELPPDVILTGYAPQRALLERAAVAVTHGGVSSVNEALSAGCPVLVLPLAKEQPLQAELVLRAGCGLAVDPLTMTDADCRGALGRLLEEASFRDRAAELRTAYAATDATSAICEGLGAIAGGERPIARLACTP